MSTEQEQKTVNKIREILKRVCVTDENVEAWLKAPHPDLGMKTPQECIDNGSTDAVLGMLESALMGNPT